MLPLPFAICSLVLQTHIEVFQADIKKRIKPITSWVAEDTAAVKIEKYSLQNSSLQGVEGGKSDDDIAKIVYALKGSHHGFFLLLPWKAFW